ncbi:MAG: hypothetical protein LBI70_01120 [Rickettsiales bacterium]|jgi:hypothetical protein|nr:hypothetical protein [Rickettsiales bacterium]
MRADRKDLGDKPRDGIAGVIGVAKVVKKAEAKWNEAVDGLRGSKIKAEGDSEAKEISLGNFRDRLSSGGYKNSEKHRPDTENMSKKIFLERVEKERKKLSAAVFKKESFLKLQKTKVQRLSEERDAAVGEENKKKKHI